MSKSILWKIILIVGIIPFSAPFVGFTYEMMISSSWTLIDWLILYSAVYWPTYIIGLFLIILSAYKLKKAK